MAFLGRWYFPVEPSATWCDATGFGSLGVREGSWNKRWNGFEPTLGVVMGTTGLGVTLGLEGIVEPGIDGEDGVPGLSWLGSPVGLVPLKGWPFWPGLTGLPPPGLGGICD